MTGVVVKIERNAKKKLDAYIRNCNVEISGFGVVDYEKGSNVVIVKDVFLLKQTCSSANTLLDASSVEQFISDKMDEDDFPLDKVKLWWHSHAKMGVFWSATDTSTMAMLKSRGMDDFLLSIVGNHAGDYKARLDVSNPFSLVMDDLPIEVFDEVDASFDETIKEEIKEKVTVNNVIIPNYGGYNKYWGDDDYTVEFPRHNKKKAKQVPLFNGMQEEDLLSSDFYVDMQRLLKIVPSETINILLQEINAEWSFGNLEPFSLEDLNDYIVCNPRKKDIEYELLEGFYEKLKKYDRSDSDVVNFE